VAGPVMLCDIGSAGFNFDSMLITEMEILEAASTVEKH